MVALMKFTRDICRLLGLASGKTCPNFQTLYSQPRVKTAPWTPVEAVLQLKTHGSGGRVTRSRSRFARICVVKPNSLVEQ